MVSSSTDSTNRLREVMLLTAVAEEYGNKLSINAEELIKKFLGSSPKEVSANEKGPVDIDHINDSLDGNNGSDNPISSETNEETSGNKLETKSDLVERSKYVPLRLSQRHRRLLRLCEAALDVSEYTDKVDILTWKTKTGRIHEQLKDICAILSGLAVAADYEVGQKMIKDRSFEQNSDYFSSVFEIGRRHKILNPECMRTDYGKLVHMLMDSQNPDIQRLLEFKLVKKVRTVYDFLKEHDALSLLKHPDVITATTAIVDRGRTRQEVQQAIKVKEAAVKRLIRKFSNDDFGEG